MSVFDHVWKDGAADLAATELRNGAMIDWQPGDGARYELVLLRHSGRDWLVCTNQHWVLFLHQTMVAETLVRKLPPGTYAGVRPLLAALGLAQGGEWFRRTDQDVAKAVHDLDAAQKAFTDAQSRAWSEGKRRERDAEEQQP